MAVLELSDVTLSLVTLIRSAIDAHPSLSGQPVSPEPPSRLTGEGLGFYLYHTEEDKTLSSLPPGGHDNPPVRFLPMALKLYYQLCAHSTQENTAAYQEQRMMGIAMKTLHDYPFLDDSSVINGIQVFQGSMRGRNNRVYVTFQNINPKDSVSIWTAGDVPLRLSAYYEVSVVFLEPEEIRSYTGRVLQYGTYIFTERAPRITTTRNIIQYNMPPDNTLARVTVQPAQVPVNSTIDIFGSAFHGDQLDLRLYSARWPEPGLAVGWNLTQVADDQLTATVMPTAVIERTGTPVDVLPGVYGAQVIVTRMVRLPNGDIKNLKYVSNQFPFMICPRIDGLVTAPGTVTVTGYLFQHPLLNASEIMVYLGEERIFLDDDGIFNAGEFRVTAANTIVIMIPASFSSGTILPVRILVSGIESTPAWITVP